MSVISSRGLMLSSNNNLIAQQLYLAKLNEQLASGKVNADLTDYDTVSAGRLLNFQNAITQKEGFISSMKTVSTRLDIYDRILTDLESITSDANTLATQNQNYDANKLPALQAQIDNYMRQVTNDLNQKVGDRYIFAGVRYSTAPVVDLTALTSAASATLYTSPNLPEYDSGYSLTTLTDANAYTKDTANFDAGYSVTYGITSNETSFQQMIAGLRFMKDATNAPDEATYKANMTQAATLLGAALTGIQTMHSGVAANQNILSDTTSNLNSDIENLKNRISDIQQVDLTRVGTEINLLQTQLQASYSATATLEQLSILKYI